MNLSFTGPADPLIERAAAAAYLKGIVLIGAAGNAGPNSPPLYPAAYPEVIAVTATNGRRQIYSAANRGKYVSVSARGVDVLVAHTGNSYATESGTSFAAAGVSGIVACLLEKRPKAGPEEIRAALQKTATGYSDTDKSGAGSGIVNALAAVAFVETSVPR
jgi:subtilisin family serine protease